MDSGKTILKNTAFLASGKAFGDLCTFLFLVYFARIFGTDILGKYAFAMAVGGGLTIFVTFGLNILVVRDVSRDKELAKRYVFNLLLVQSLLATVIWVFIILLALFLPVDTESKIIVVIIGTYHVFCRMTMLLQSQFRAYEEMQYSALLEVFQKVVILVLAVPAIIIGSNAMITLAAYPVSAMFTYVTGMWISIFRYGRLELRVEFPLIKTLLGKAMPFLAMQVLGESYLRLGIIFLTFFHGESAAGIYAAGDRLIVTIMVGVQIFGSALLPAMSRMSGENREAAFKLLERSVRLILVAVLPLSTMLFLVRGPVIQILFGPEFSDSSCVFGIYCWSILFVGLDALLSGFLIVQNQQRQLVILQTVTAIAYCVFCLILIPNYSYNGLAYVRLVTDTILFAGAYIYISKSYCSLPMLRMATGPMLACGTTVLAFFLLNGFGLWVAVPFASTVCVTTMFLFKAVRVEDFKFAKRILLKSDVAPLEDGTTERAGISRRSQTFWERVTRR